MESDLDDTTTERKKKKGGWPKGRPRKQNEQNDINKESATK